MFAAVELWGHTYWEVLHLNTVLDPMICSCLASQCNFCLRLFAWLLWLWSVCTVESRQWEAFIIFSKKKCFAVLVWVVHDKGRKWRGGNECKCVCGRDVLSWAPLTHQVYWWWGSGSLRMWPFSEPSSLLPVLIGPLLTHTHTHTQWAEQLVSCPASLYMTMPNCT